MARIHAKRALAAALVVLGCARATAEDAPRRTENVVLVTLDGLRGREMFAGADPALLNAEVGGVKDVAATRREFWRDAAGKRREALLPFLWKVVAAKGQILGNRERGSVVEVANAFKFSYPSYNEMLTGIVDPAIDSNEKKPNPNVTVLEWLNARPELRGRIGAFCSWDAFPFILNRARSGLYVNAAREAVEEEGLTRRQHELNQRMKDETPRGSDHRSDALTVEMALEWMKRHRPRVLYVNLSETDGWAHLGRYDEVLKSAHGADALLRQLWETIEATDGYRGKTTLLITTDHGRGDGVREWRVHGAGVEGAQYVWVAALGPDTAPLGERSATEKATLSRIAATVAALVGEDYRAAVPAAAPPIADLLPARR